MHVRPRHHHLAHLNLAQLHRALNELHLRGRHQAAVARLLDHHLQLFGGANERVAVGRDHAERAHHPFGNSIEQINRPAERVQKPLKRARDQQRHAFGARQAQALGDKLAQHDLQHGQQPERDHERDAVRYHRRPRPRDRRNQRTQERGKGKFPDVSEQEARDGDADLHAGNHAAQVTQQMLDDLGARVAFFHQLTHARKPNGDQGKFRRGKECVHADEKQNNEKSKNNHCVAAFTAPPSYLHVRRTESGGHHQAQS